jgi:periplasmic protein CpxP/Spy
MNRRYLIIIFISVLLISNLTLAYYLTQKTKMNEENNPRNIIIQTLKFDDYQSAQLDQLIIIHKKEIRERNDQINTLKNSLYEMLPNDSQSEIKVDSITSKIGNIQKNIENIHFNHFLDIKRICHPTQHDAFIKLSSKLQKIFHAKRNLKNKPE